MQLKKFHLYNKIYPCLVVDVEVRKVLDLMKKDTIIRLYLQGYSKSEISRIVHCSRPTVRKYITEYEEYEKKIGQAKTLKEKEDLIIKSNEKPSYDVSNRKRYKITTEIMNRIEELIEKNEHLARSNKRKLMMKKKDMHRILQREGFDIGYRSVCNLVNELRPKAKEAYIRQEVDPGDIAEFDWGDVTLAIKELGGTERRYKIGVFALKHSDNIWANLYSHENTECFLDAHSNFFEDIGGVTKEIVYDNARVQVKQFVGHEKKPTDAVIRLSNYYGYNYRFTNAYSGNEKGHVERSVEVVRRRAYCEKQCFDTIADAVAALKLAVYELNQEVKQRTGKSAAEVFADEKRFLQLARIRLDVGVVQTRKVNKYSFIYVDSNFYSVPDYLVGKDITIKKYPRIIKVFYNDVELLTIDRIYGKNEYKVDITHYIRTLKKKPGAIRNSLALKKSTSWLQEIFHKYFNTKPKEFVGLLELIKQFDIDSVKRVIKKLEMNQLNINISQIEYLLRDSSILIDKDPDILYNDINQKCLSQLEEIERLHLLNSKEGVVC